MDDLSRGSAGTLDPFIGAQSLPQGVYYLAVTNANPMPMELEQYRPAESCQPADASGTDQFDRAIAEDRIERPGGSLIATGPKST